MVGHPRWPCAPGARALRCDDEGMAQFALKEDESNPLPLDPGNPFKQIARRVW